MRCVFALLLLSLVACGPDDSPPPTKPPVVQPPPPPPPAVSSDFNGRWIGSLVITSPGQQPVSGQGSLVLTANGQSLSATGFCPDGTGTMSVSNQQGRSVNWTGHEACIYSSSSCASTTLVYRSATLSLDSSNALTVVAYGTLQGCGASFETTTTFTGRK